MMRRVECLFERKRRPYVVAILVLVLIWYFLVTFFSTTRVAERRLLAEMEEKDKMAAPCSGNECARLKREVAHLKMLLALSRSKS